MIFLVYMMDYSTASAQPEGTDVPLLPSVGCILNHQAKIKTPDRDVT